MIGALVIGFIGSLHCVAMCGPLMLSFTNVKEKQGILASLSYHTGRISFYVMIGLLIGVVAEYAAFYSVQKYLSLAIGLLLILLFAFPVLKHKLEGLYYHSRFYTAPKQFLSKFFPSRFKWLAAGVLNGLLPCGLVYLAAAGAVLSGSWTGSALYMIIFGLGTLPGLIILRLSYGSVKPLLSRIPNLSSSLLIISGFLLVGRSLLIHSPNLNQLIQDQIMNVMTVCGL